MESDQSDDQDGFVHQGGRRQQKAKKHTKRCSRPLDFVNKVHNKVMVTPKNKGGDADKNVYSYTILEYLTAEVLKLTGNASKDLRMKRINPRHLQLDLGGTRNLTR